MNLPTLSLADQAVSDYSRVMAYRAIARYEQADRLDWYVLLVRGLFFNDSPLADAILRSRHWERFH